MSILYVFATVLTFKKFIPLKILQTNTLTQEIHVEQRVESFQCDVMWTGFSLNLVTHGVFPLAVLEGETVPRLQKDCGDVS